jgi:excinuclease UvrABC helicase subunit UvrB
MGQAILCGDSLTDSMARAIKVTKERRAVRKQNTAGKEQDYSLFDHRRSGTIQFCLS